MPIQDAIKFVETLVYVTIQMSKFVPGAQTVGGDIDIAVITKHEEFKWIKRKHYFNKKLNPNDKRRYNEIQLMYSKFSKNNTR